MNRSPLEPGTAWLTNEPGCFPLNWKSVSLLFFNSPTLFHTLSLNLSWGSLISLSICLSQSLSFSFCSSLLSLIPGFHYFISITFWHAFSFSFSVCLCCSVVCCFRMIPSFSFCPSVLILLTYSIFLIRCVCLFLCYVSWLFLLYSLSTWKLSISKQNSSSSSTSCGLILNNMLFYLNLVFYFNCLQPDMLC